MSDRKPGELPTRSKPKREGPSKALSYLFMLMLLAIVVPLMGFVAAVSMESQAGLNAFTTMLKGSFYVIGAIIFYGFAVGLYHTVLAVTGLDKPRA